MLGLVSGSGSGSGKWTNLELGLGGANIGADGDGDGDGDGASTFELFTPPLPPPLLTRAATIKLSTLLTSSKLLSSTAAP